MGSLLSQSPPPGTLTLPLSPLAVQYCIRVLNLGCLQNHMFSYPPEVTVLPASQQTRINQGCLNLIRKWCWNDYSRLLQVFPIKGHVCFLVCQGSYYSRSFSGRQELTFFSPIFQMNKLTHGKFVYYGSNYTWDHIHLGWISLTTTHSSSSQFSLFNFFSVYVINSVGLGFTTPDLGIMGTEGWWWRR